MGEQVYEWKNRSKQGNVWEHMGIDATQGHISKYRWIYGSKGGYMQIQGGYKDIQGGTWEYRVKHGSTREYMEAQQDI